MHPRGFYQDAAAARGVLAAVGGEARSATALAPNIAPIRASNRREFRGVCGNGSKPAGWITIEVPGGDRRQRSEHCGYGRCTRKDDCPCGCSECYHAERIGCQNEAEPPTGNSIPCACAGCRGITDEDGIVPRC